MVTIIQYVDQGFRRFLRNTPGTIRLADVQNKTSTVCRRGRKFPLYFSAVFDIRDGGAPVVKADIRTESNRDLRLQKFKNEPDNNITADYES